MCSGAEAGSYLRLIDSCITQLRAQGPSRTCNESKEDRCGYLGEWVLRGSHGGCADRVLEGPASGGKGSKGGN